MWRAKEDCMNADRMVSKIDEMAATLDDLVDKFAALTQTVNLIAGSLLSPSSRNSRCSLPPPPLSFFSLPSSLFDSYSATSSTRRSGTTPPGASYSAGTHGSESESSTGVVDWRAGNGRQRDGARESFWQW